MTFYEWMMKKYHDQDNCRGELARRMELNATKLPAIKTIDSFSDLVDLVDQNRPERYCHPYYGLGKGSEALNDTLWLEYCEETGHHNVTPQEYLAQSQSK